MERDGVSGNLQAISTLYHELFSTVYLQPIGDILLSLMYDVYLFNDRHVNVAHR